MILNFGIITGIGWHSRGWKGEPKEQDLLNSKYGNIEYNITPMYESLNFCCETYPSEKDGYFIGHSPQLYNKVSRQNSKDVKIVFLKSRNYSDNKTYLVGFYGFPQIGNFYRESSKNDLYKKYDGGTLKAQPKNIIELHKHLEISNEICEKRMYLPNNKKLGQQGFNYITSKNVTNILNDMLNKNPKNMKLRAFMNEIDMYVQGH